MLPPSTLSFVRSLSVSAGMAMATSCFAMIAGLAADAGRWLLPALLLSLAIALAVAHAVGGLARRFPSALGLRTYIKAAFGNTASLFFVFVYLVMIALVAGVESQLYAGIVHTMLPALDAWWIVPLLFGAVFALNTMGQEVSRNVQVALVALMAGSILALSVHALLPAPAALPQAAVLNAQAGASIAVLPATAVAAFFLFVGFEWVTSAQSGSRQTAAQLPRVLLASVLLLGTVYVAFGAAALAHLDGAQLAATRAPQLLIAGRLWGEPGRWLMLAASTAAVLMAFNAGVLGASRLVYSLAREGFMPRAFTVTLVRSGAPMRAIAATVAVSIAASLAVGTWQAADLFGRTAATLICICYAGLLAASLALARKDAVQRPLWARLVEAIALIVMLLLLAAMAAAPQAWPAVLGAAAACGLCALCSVAAHARAAARSSATLPATAGSRAV